MSVNFKPFESKSGFLSPNFSVDENGNLTVGDVDATGSFRVNGIAIIDASDSTISLDDIIKYSGLTRVGTLEYLNIDGDLIVSQGSTPYINIVDGKVDIFSSSDVGSINNITIGQTTPVAGSFTELVATSAEFSESLTVAGNITVDAATINTAPTTGSHATRKDYVDARISAFAIAFGA